MTDTLQRTSASHRRLEEEMRDSNEKKDAVAHWEGQIAEIIQWYVLCFIPPPHPTPLEFAAFIFKK